MTRSELIKPPAVMVDRERVCPKLGEKDGIIPSHAYMVSKLSDGLRMKSRYHAGDWPAHITARSCAT